MKWFTRKREDPYLALAQQQTLLMQEMLQTVAKMTEATKAQADSLNTYLSLFAVTTPPTSRTVRDADEWEQELARKGFPTTGTAAEQAQWVLDQTE